MTKVFVNHENIDKFLKNRFPFIFVDSAIVNPGCASFAMKNFTNNEWFFPCHFPDNPIVPGSLLLECLFQSAILCLTTDNMIQADYVYPRKLKDVSFLSPAYPGDQLHVEAKIVSGKRGVFEASGVAYVMRQTDRLSQNL